MENNVLKILIAEDDDMTFSLYQMMLRNSNLEIIRAKNGIEAIEIFKQNPDISLIIMDMIIPLMDGYQAVFEIRNIGCSLPILGISGMSTSEEHARILEVGCNLVMGKPFKKEHLLKTIGELLNLEDNN